MGLNQQPLDRQSNALLTVLARNLLGRRFLKWALFCFMHHFICWTLFISRSNRAWLYEGLIGWHRHKIVTLEVDLEVVGSILSREIFFFLVVFSFNTGRILPQFGRKWRNIEKLDWLCSKDLICLLKQCIWSEIKGCTIFLGAYVPLTKVGKIIVDGVLTSCYADFDHDVAHDTHPEIHRLNEVDVWKWQGISNFCQYYKKIGHLSTARGTLLGLLNLSCAPSINTLKNVILENNC